MQLFIFFLLLHLGINDAYTQDDTVAAHSGYLHINIHRRPCIDQPVCSCENTLLVQFPENIFPGKTFQERFPVLFIYTGHGIASCGCKEILAMPFYRQFFNTDLRRVFNKIVSIQINHKKIIIVCRKSSRNLSKGCAFIRFLNGEHGNRNRNAARDSISMDAPGKGMDNRTVRHLFIKERTIFVIATLFNDGYKG